MAKNKVNDESQILAPAAYTVALLAVAVLLTALSSYALPHGRMMMQDDNYYTARILLSGFNILLCTYLMFAYVRDYLALRSEFMLGVIAFLFAFLLYGFSSFPLLQYYLGYPMQGMGGMGAFAFVPMAFTAIALVIFLKISQR